MGRSWYEERQDQEDASQGQSSMGWLKEKWDDAGNWKFLSPTYTAARGGKYLAERTGLIDTEEEKKLARELEEDKARLREQAKTGITPELRQFARQAAQARAALGSRFSDRRLSPEQRARMLGRASVDLQGRTAQGGAELQRSGREIAEQNLRAINEKRRAEINAQQAQMMNAALTVASTGAGLMAGPAAGMAVGALGKALGPNAPSAPNVEAMVPRRPSMFNSVMGQQDPIGDYVTSYEDPYYQGQPRGFGD